ncbi:MAG: thioredoxin domain-containing protein, partial [Rhizobiales bacterium]|nr:thioredoxin domain-containing protein [Hyphomicrobiales bacterium]
SANWLSDQDEKQLKKLRDILLTARNKRKKPKLDDKILCDWNGMAITSLTLASDTLGKPEWRELAIKAYNFIKTTMHTNEGLHHSYRLGKCSSPAIYSDYAQIIRAALTLYNSTGNKEFINDAERWLNELNENFWCEDFGGYFITGKNRKDVIIRGKTGADEATPNGNAVMVSNLMALYVITGDENHKEKAKKIVQCFGNAIAKNIFSHVGLLAGSIDIMAPIQIVIVKKENKDPQADEMLKIIKQAPVSTLVIQTIEQDENIPENSPLTGKKLIDGKTTAYICVDQTCQEPTTNKENLLSNLKKAKEA